MSAKDELINAINSATNVTYRDSKAELVSYYQKQYPGTGRGGWKQHIIQDTLAAKGITKSGVGDKEYARLSKNMSKRFDPSRLNNPEPRNKKDYEALGKRTEPISRSPKGNSITITVKGQQGNGRGGTRDRTVTGTISGPDAYSFVNNPNWSDFWDLIDWGYPFDMDEDNEYALTNVSVSAS